MPVKWLIILLSFSPVILFAQQENDIELFEFIAMYEQDDNIFIDAEMDDKDGTAEVENNKSLAIDKMTKSESDE